MTRSAALRSRRRKILLEQMAKGMRLYPWRYTYGRKGKLPRVVLSSISDSEYKSKGQEAVLSERRSSASKLPAQHSIAETCRRARSILVGLMTCGP